jgi:hypothetical protein
MRRKFLQASWLDVATIAALWPGRLASLYGVATGRDKGPSQWTNNTLRCGEGSMHRNFCR